MANPRIRLPLYLKILGWLGLNLTLVLVVLFAFAAHQEVGLNMLLTQAVRERVESIARNVGDELYTAAEQDRPAILRRANAQYRVRFHATARPGRPHFDGPPPEHRPPPPGPPRHLERGPPDRAFGPPDDGPRGGPGPHNVVIDVHRAQSSSGYEVRVDLNVLQRSGPPARIHMSIGVDGLAQLFRFLGIERQLILVGAILVLSALFWWPFVWHITRAIRQLLAATEQMALGKLDARVPANRRDELGSLAIAVNTMGERLQGLLQGQRQFMADVAHEVISPVARIQIGLGILEAQAPARSTATVNDIREDLDQMSTMLHELLLYSRSGVEAERASTATVDLRAIVDQVCARDAGEIPITVDMQPELFAQGHPAMLQRAVSNLVRNAQRYATGSTAPIEIAGWVDEEHVYLAVRDRGPGVLEEALGRLGEPFFRPESARSRATGGFGLGLAIVRRCVAACNGDVNFTNRVGGGFEARIVLPAQDP